MGKLWIVCFAVLLSGCFWAQQTLEYDFVLTPQVKLAANEAGPYLKISGQCGHSGLVVETIRQIQEGRTLIVEVQVSPFQRDKASGAFETEVYLDGTDFVVFGEKRTLLWRRVPGTKPDTAKKPVFVPEEKK